MVSWGLTALQTLLLLVSDLNGADPFQGTDS